MPAASRSEGRTRDVVQALALVLAFTLVAPWRSSTAGPPQDSKGAPPPTYVALEGGPKPAAFLRLSPPPDGGLWRELGRNLRDPSDEAFSVRARAGLEGVVFIHAEALESASLEALAAAERAGGPYLHPDSSVTGCIASAPIASQLRLATGSQPGLRAGLDVVRAPRAEGGDPPRTRGEVVWWVHDGIALRLVAEGGDSPALLDAVLRWASLRKEWATEDLKSPGLAVQADLGTGARAAAIRLPVGPLRSGRPPSGSRLRSWLLPSPGRRAADLEVSIALLAAQATEPSALRTMGRALDANLRRVAAEHHGPVEIDLGGGSSAYAVVGVVLGSVGAMDTYLVTAWFSVGEGGSGATWAITLKTRLDEDPLVAWRSLRGILRTVEVPASTPSVGDGAKSGR